MICIQHGNALVKIISKKALNFKIRCNKLAVEGEFTLEIISEEDYRSRLRQPRMNIKYTRPLMNPLYEADMTRGHVVARAYAEMKLRKC